MGELSRTIEQRLADAYASLRAAQAEGDAYLADIRMAEIEELKRIAAAHDLGIPLPSCD
ncbi:hypothetical protein [Thermomonospora catenispora]|uniref:hypothetical protein n=1 Tax=Thermomonospora catenispora TaxID=2493090 RepID=UPI00158C6F52|nr:hypothetical protein [Thermomonospora catenispora]